MLTSIREETTTIKILLNILVELITQDELAII